MNILTPNGYKDISKVNIGDKVIGKDGVENTLLGKTYLDYKYYKDAESLKEYKFFLVNGRKFFVNQSIYCNGNVTHIYLLQKGDTINYQGQGEVVSSLIESEFDGSNGWWRLEISGDHTYISDGVLLHNASRFLVGGGTGNWNSNTNWSATDGGASGASFPVNGDAVQFTTASGATNITVNVASACTSLICSATYTGTLTMDADLTVAGTLTLIAGMTIAGTVGYFIVATTATITSAGKTVPNLRLSGPTTITLADTWTVSDTALLGNSTNTTTINGNTINCASLTINVTSGIVTGTTTIVMNGTGTWSHPNNTSPGALRNNLTFNTAGTITIGAVFYNTGTITYTAGTINVSGYLGTRGVNITFNTNGMTWSGLSIGIASTITLNSDFQMSADILTTFTGTLTINGSALSGVSINSSSATLTIGGSSNLTFTAGTISGTGLTINKTNTITFSGAITWTVTTFTRTAGTLTATGSTLTMSGSRTFAGATTWDNWTTSGTGTITTNALQTLAGTLTVGGGFTTTFAGSNGVLSCANLTLGASSTLVIPTNATVTSTTTINASGSVINGAFTLNTGGLTMNGNLTGTLSLINFNATGTWSGIGVVIHNTTVNTAGTLTISGTVHYKTGTFTYTSGTVTVTSSTLSIDGSCTFEGALTWNNWTVAVASTITINALQTLSGTLTLQATTTFTGTTGWTTNSFVCTTAGLTHTFKQAITYTVTGTMAMVGTPKNKIKFISASTPTKAILTFTNPQTVYYVSPTDIDSSAGNPVLTIGGIITNTLNWSQVLYPTIVTITG